MPNTCLNVSNSTQELHEDMSGENGSQYCIVAIRGCITRSFWKAWLINFTSSWKTTCQVGKISMCCVPLIADHSKTYDTVQCPFLRGIDMGARKLRKLWKGNGERGFCQHISHGGYQKQPDAVRNKWRPENKVPYLYNEVSMCICVCVWWELTWFFPENSTTNPL